jgi:hypothetical protein
MTTNNRIPAPPLPPRPAPSAPPLPGMPTPWANAPQTQAGRRVLVYGQGGLGKSRLCCAAPGPVLVFDFDESLGTLWGQLPEEQRKNVMTYIPESWQDFMDKFSNMDLFGNVKTIVIDTATVAERASEAWVLQNVRAPSGKATSIEDYGYGKGYRFIYEQWIKLLSIADVHRRANRNVVFVAHAVNAKTANASGEDFLRVEPGLQGTDKFSIRNRLYEWVDYCVYIDRDKAVSEDGKVQGGDSRTLYTSGAPWYMAKQRGNAPEVIYPDVNNLEDVWTQLFA